jgi:hypothetical protein
MTLIGENFHLFEEYDISKKEIEEAHFQYDQRQQLQNNFCLYIKSFESLNSRRRLLLLATQLVEYGEALGFAFWVPTEYKVKEATPLDILLVFANHFGFRFTIGQTQGFFIEQEQRLIYGRLENPLDLLKMEIPDAVPCECYLSASENPVQGINRVSIFYAFLLNRGKYKFWIDSAPTVKLAIKSGWAEYAKSNFIDYLQPDGRTRVTIDKQKDTQELLPDKSGKMSILEVPKIYEKQFEFIFGKINSLKDKEYIGFHLSFGETRKCLFCQSEELSKEHIFPKWIRPYVVHKVFEGTRFNLHNGENLLNVLKSATTSGKKVSSEGYTTDLVCVTCNNEWLSVLEERAKEILVRDDKIVEVLPDTLSNEQILDLSRWLVIKGLLLTLRTCTNIHQFPYKTFESLKGGRIDDGFLVEVVTADRSNFDFFVGKGPFHEGLIKTDKILRDRAVEMCSNFFTCTLQFQNILFRITYLDPSLPFKRESTLKKTRAIYPLGFKLQHEIISNDGEQWVQISKDNLEWLMFGIAIRLVETKT